MKYAGNGRHVNFHAPSVSGSRSNSVRLLTPIIGPAPPNQRCNAETVARQNSSSASQWRDLRLKRRDTRRGKPEGCAPQATFVCTSSGNPRRILSETPDQMRPYFVDISKSPAAGTILRLYQDAIVRLSWKRLRGW